MAGVSLVVGNTGVGKSSFINIMCNEASTVVSSSTNSCTTETKIHGNFVDVPGGRDSRGIDDQTHFQNLLRLLKQKGWKVKAVIWVINENVRADQDLQDQVSFLNQLSPEIWNHVIILIKKMSTDPDEAKEQAQGAMVAADRDLPYWGYHLTYQEKKDGSYINRADIRDKMNKLINSIPGTFTIEHKISQCTKCGITDDDRLFPLTCHTQMLQVHSGRKHLHHPGTLNNYHKSTTTVKTIISRRHASSSFCPKCNSNSNFTKCYYSSTSWVSSWKCANCGKRIYKGDEFWHCMRCCDRDGHREIPLSIVVACSGMFCLGCDVRKCGCSNSEGCIVDEAQIYTCCNNRYGSPPCSKKWSCCEKWIGENGCKLKWDCCGVMVDITNNNDLEGCRKICQSCKGDWANDSVKGCKEKEPHDLKSCEVIK